MRTRLYLVAVVLFAAQATQASFAEDAAPAASMAGPIDASVAPSHHVGKSEHDRQVKNKFKFGSVSSQRVRSSDIHGTSAPITRNAIGVAVTHNESATHDAAPAAVRPAGVPASTGNASAAVKIEPAVEHSVVVHVNASPTVAAPPVGMGARIDGSSVVRHGSAPAVVGGQTKVVGGISGSTIRPKH